MVDNSVYVGKAFPDDSEGCVEQSIALVIEEDPEVVDDFE